MRIIAEDETGGALDLPVEELAALAAEGVLDELGCPFIQANVAGLRSATAAASVTKTGVKRESSALAPARTPRSS